MINQLDTKILISALVTFAAIAALVVILFLASVSRKYSLSLREVTVGLDQIVIDVIDKERVSSEGKEIRLQQHLEKQRELKKQEIKKGNIQKLNDFVNPAFDNFLKSNRDFSLYDDSDISLKKSAFGFIKIVDLNEAPTISVKNEEYLDYLIKVFKEKKFINFASLESEISDNDIKEIAFQLIKIDLINSIILLKNKDIKPEIITIYDAIQFVDQKNKLKNFELSKSLVQYFIENHLGDNEKFEKVERFDVADNKVYKSFKIFNKENFSEADPYGVELVGSKFNNIEEKLAKYLNVKDGIFSTKTHKENNLLLRAWIISCLEFYKNPSQVINQEGFDQILRKNIELLEEIEKEKNEFVVIDSKEDLKGFENSSEDGDEQNPDLNISIEDGDEQNTDSIDVNNNEEQLNNNRIKSEPDSLSNNVIISSTVISNTQITKDKIELRNKKKERDKKEKEIDKLNNKIAKEVSSLNDAFNNKAFHNAESIKEKFVELLNSLKISDQTKESMLNGRNDTTTVEGRLTKLENVLKLRDLVLSFFTSLEASHENRSIDDLGIIAENFKNLIDAMYLVCNSNDAVNNFRKKLEKDVATVNVKSILENEIYKELFGLCFDSVKRYFDELAIQYKTFLRESSSINEDENIESTLQKTNEGHQNTNEYKFLKFYNTIYSENGQKKSEDKFDKLINIASESVKNTAATVSNFFTGLKNPFTKQQTTVATTKS
jgi:hypothetical protein